jgi:hypothetical protein
MKMVKFSLSNHLVTPDHLLLDSAPNFGPLKPHWEINKFENCWYKSVTILEVLKLLFQQFPNLSSSQQDMSGPILRNLSNNRWLEGTVFKHFSRKSLRTRISRFSSQSFEFYAKSKGSMIKKNQMITDYPFGLISYFQPIYHYFFKGSSKILLRKFDIFLDLETISAGSQF